MRIYNEVEIFDRYENKRHEQTRNHPSTYLKSKDGKFEKKN